MSQKSVEELIAELSNNSRVMIVYNPHRNGGGILGDTFFEYVVSSRKTMRIQRNHQYFMTEEEAKKVEETNVMWEVKHRPRDEKLPPRIHHYTVAATLRVALEHALNGPNSNNIFADTTEEE